MPVMHLITNLSLFLAPTPIGWCRESPVGLGNDPEGTPNSTALPSSHDLFFLFLARYCHMAQTINPPEGAQRAYRANTKCANRT